VLKSGKKLLKSIYSLLLKVSANFTGFILFKLAPKNNPGERNEYYKVFKNHLKEYASIQ
jgi:hypothetical protein